MALTVIAGVTKVSTQKSAMQLSFGAKEDLADDLESLPAEALKFCELKLTGENDGNAFGTSTLGQKFDGKLIVYAADAAIRNYCHELVTKVIKHVEVTTISGKSYTLAVGAGVDRPALQFAYENADLITQDNKPVIITLLMSGFRDNLVMS